jgi:flagellar motor switch protein FliG
MARNTFDNPSGVRKASILMVSCGAAASAEVFKHLTDAEIETLADAMMRVEQVDDREREAVIREFVRECAALAAGDPAN